MEKEILLTAQGKKDIEEELDMLKTIKRKEIADKIELARSYGDLSENSEYDDAKNEQAQMEARIADLEVTLKRARLIDESSLNDERVHIGSKVRFYNETTGDDCEYMIVSASESDPLKGKISDESPIGAGLKEKSVGDVAVVELPNGSTVRLRIEAISR